MVDCAPNKEQVSICLKALFVSSLRNDIAILRQYRYIVKYRPPGRYIHLRKEILIMKDKSTKQPWPRSAAMAVFVLALLAVAEALVIGGLCKRIQELKPMTVYLRHLPMEEPTKEIKPKAKEAVEVSAPQISEIQEPVARFWVPPLYGMSPELKKKIFVDGEGACNFFGTPVDFRELPGGERIDVLRNGQMVYNGSLLTKEGADLLEEWFRKRQPKPIRFSSHPCDDSK